MTPRLHLGRLEVKKWLPYGQPSSKVNFEPCKILLVKKEEKKKLVCSISYWILISFLIFRYVTTTRKQQQYHYWLQKEILVMCLMVNFCVKQTSLLKTKSLSRKIINFLSLQLCKFSLHLDLSERYQ